MAFLSSSPIHENSHVATAETSATFGNFAAEIYLKVVEHLHNAKDIARLARTCRKFRDVIDRDGWRIFVQIHFPTIINELPPGLENWRDLAWSLTSQSRAWDKRAFSMTPLTADSRCLNQLTDAFDGDLNLDEGLSKKINTPSLLRWVKASQKLSPFFISVGTSIGRSMGFRPPPSPRHQSTPFHPVIDTKVQFSGKYSSKKETVVWSTGPEILIRVRRSGSFLPSSKDTTGDHAYLDAYSSKVNFLGIQHEKFRSGIDDVTFLNIMNPSKQLRDSLSSNIAIDVIAGRASGLLHRFSVSEAGPSQVVVNTFHSFQDNGLSFRRSIRSGDVNSRTEASLLVACSEKVISLYEIEGESHDIWPLSEFEIDFDLQRAQAWTAKFSSNEDLLLGLGHSALPLHAYKASPTGLVLTEKLGGKCDVSDSLGLVHGSVYAIEPLSGVSRAGGSTNGDVFLTGSYDGVCRLYDRRTGGSPVQSIYDSIDTESAVYSLASFGHERFLSGSANSRLKIFDFRNSSKVYYYTDALDCSGFDQNPKKFWNSKGGLDWESVTPGEKCHHDFRTDKLRICRFHSLSRLERYRRNTSIFLYGAAPIRNNHNRVVSRRQVSPVFSLSSPDPICPIVYAGTTGTVYELEVSETDGTGNLLDPYFTATPHAGLVKDVEQLAMYEMDQGGDDLHTSAVDLLWEQTKRPSSKNLTPIAARERLDMRWQIA